MAERLRCDVHKQTEIEGWYFVDGDATPRPLCRECKSNLELSQHNLVRAALSGQPIIKVTIRDQERADRLAAEWAER